MTLAVGHKVSRKQILLHTFLLNGRKFGDEMKQFKLNILKLVLSGIFVI